MLAYIYSWFYSEPVTYLPKYPEVSLVRPQLISEEDLLKVNLKPLNVIPSPARNMPNLDKFTLQVLSKAQLEDVLAVRLKKTTVAPRKTWYEPRHPVLKELLGKFNHS